MSCDVCCQTFNKKHHTPVNCPGCDLKSCRRCTETYLLSMFEDPHCMGCKAQWSRIYIDSWCTKNFRNMTYRQHRENVLYEREKALFPRTQVVVEKIIKRARLRDEINAQRSEMFRLWRLHGIFHLTHQLREWMIFTENKFPELRVIQERLRELYTEVDELNEETDMSEEVKKFVRKCPTDECKGFLNEEWKCGLCEMSYCEKCNELTGHGHECDPETVKTMSLINKDTKPCPKCGTMIQKLEGCLQMWCPSCHTAFNWRTGSVDVGRIHNPHYLEFRRKGGSMNRENSDIPCGGIPSFTELRQNHSPEQLVRFRIELDYLERDAEFYYREQNTEFPRRRYMMNTITEVQFKREIQKIDKANEKSREIQHLYRMMIDTCGDFLRQYVLEKDYARVRVNINQVVDYFNSVVQQIHKRYNCYTPSKIAKIY